MAANLNEKGIYKQLVTSEGYRYFYEIHRHPAPKMSPIVFVGGAFQDIGSWKKFVEYFSTITTVVAVDLPGSGNSEQLPTQYDFDYISEALAGLLDAEDIDNIYLFSASYGAAVAYQFTRHHYDKVDKLIMAGVLQTVPEATRQNIAASLEAIKAGDTETFIDIVLQGLLSNSEGMDGRKRAFTRKVLARQLGNLSNEQVAKFICNTQRVLDVDALEIEDLHGTDTLIFTGEYDDFTDIEDCRGFARDLGNATFFTIDQADHLCHLQQFDVVRNVIEQHGMGRPLNSIEGCSNYERFQHAG